MFATNFKELNDTIPAGIYEAAISGVEDDGTKIVIELEIRKDIPQDCAGRTLSHWMYKLREPKEIDQAVGGYSYNQLMRLGKAARLPEGKSYGSLSEYLADLVGKAVQVELWYEEYNSKKYLKVKYWNESNAPALTYHPAPREARQGRFQVNSSTSTTPVRNAPQNAASVPSEQYHDIPANELPWG